MGFIILAILLLAGGFAFYASYTKPSRKNNSFIMLSFASLPLFVVAVMALDLMLEVSGYGATCGEGFTKGNCFLLDGLSVIGYFIFIPILLLASCSFLLANYLKKRQKIKPKNSIATSRRALLYTLPAYLLPVIVLGCTYFIAISPLRHEGFNTFSPFLALISFVSVIMGIFSIKYGQGWQQIISVFVTFASLLLFLILLFAMRYIFY